MDIFTESELVELAELFGVSDIDVCASYASKGDKNEYVFG